MAGVNDVLQIGPQLQRAEHVPGSGKCPWQLVSGQMTDTEQLTSGGHSCDTLLGLGLYWWGIPGPGSTPVGSDKNRATVWAALILHRFQAPSSFFLLQVFPKASLVPFLPIDTHVIQTILKLKISRLIAAEMT